MNDVGCLSATSYRYFFFIVKLSRRKTLALKAFDLEVAVGLHTH